MEPNAEQGSTVGQDIRASIEALQARDEPADKTEPAGKTEPVGKTEPAGKTEPVGKTEPAGKTELAGKTEPVAKTEPAGKTEPVKLTDAPPVVSQKVSANQGPRSWKPELREKWATLPSEVQTEVMRREMEVTRALQETARAREFAQQFYEAAAPYQQLIALEGGDPLVSFGNYLKTATILRSGSPAEKANAVAQAIHSYGVDITMLDGALANTIAGKGPIQQSGQQQQFRDPRVDELLGHMTERQQQEEQQLAEELAEEVTAFATDPANEFFEDVRMDVSVLLGVAAERKQKMTLKEAYDKACMLNPNISKVIEQRKAAKAVADAKAAEVARRNAGSSVTGGAPRQTGTKENDASSSVRAAIEDSIARLST